MVTQSKRSAIFITFISVFAIVFSTWLMVHTFSYDPRVPSMGIAGKCWSDFGAHIPMIRSFSMGGNFDRITHFQMPEYPIFPGEPIRYHFLFYMFVGLMEKMGLRIDYSLNILSVCSFAGLLILIAVLSYTLFHTGMKKSDVYAISCLSIIFFLFNGSLSFLRFFAKHPLSFQTIGDIVNNTEFPSFGPWDQGLVSAFWNLNIYTNQRHLATGFALGLLFIYICLSIQHRPWKKQLVFLWITVPMLILLPYLHQPMLIVIGIFMIWYFLVFPKLRIFLLLTGILSVGHVSYQVFSLAKDASAFAWQPGYLIPEPITLMKFLTYWFHNLGLSLILIPIGFFLGPWNVKKAVMPIFFLFIIANLFKFSVEIAANHKFFNFFMIFGNMLGAYAIIRIWNLTHGAWGGKIFADRFPSFTKNRNEPRKNIETTKGINFQDAIASSGSRKFDHPVQNIFIISFFCLLILSLTLSGIIDFFAVANDQKMTVVDVPRSDIMLWITHETPKTAVFLNTSYLYNPASLAGRSIFLGWPYFAWSAGYKENRMPNRKLMYESKDPAIFCPLLITNNISYVTVEKVAGNQDDPDIDPAYFRSITTPIVSNSTETFDIYTTQSLCPSL